MNRVTLNFSSSRQRVVAVITLLFISLPCGVHGQAPLLNQSQKNQSPKKPENGVGSRVVKNPFFDSQQTIKKSADASKEVASSEPSQVGQPGSTKYVTRTVESIELNDEKRDKILLVRVTYPDGTGPFPVIVWSHGMYGSKDNYQPLIKPWVAAGYVVIQPTHSDSLSLLPPREIARTLVSMKLDKTDDWHNRPIDVQFILDNLSELERQQPSLKGKFDSTRIGVGGHSFGAVTTQLMAGTNPRTTRATRDMKFSDDRPLAFVAISPNGAGVFFPFDGFSKVTKPMLFVSGDHDKGRNGEKAEWRRDAYDGANAGEKYLAWVSGAHHNFGGISGSPKRIRKLIDQQGDENPRYVELVVTSTLTFWDATLKGDEGAKKQLAGDDSLGSIPAHEMSWEHK